MGTRDHVTSLFFPQVNPELKGSFEEKGMKFVGQDVEGERMEVVELEGECLYEQLVGVCGRYVAINVTWIALHSLDERNC